MTSTKKAHLQRSSSGAGQGVVRICGRLCTVFIQNIRRFSAALYSFAAILALLSPVFPCFCECLLKDVLSVDVIKRRMPEPWMKAANLFHGSEDTFQQFVLKLSRLLNVRFFRIVFVIMNKYSNCRECSSNSWYNYISAGNFPPKIT